jgi:hypothetical protein
VVWQEVLHDTDSKAPPKWSGQRPLDDFIIQRQNSSSVSQQQLAVSRENHAATGSIENARADHLLEALDLQTNC